MSQVNPSIDGRGSRPLSLLALCLAVLCYGTIPVFLNYLADFLDVWTVNAVRYSIAALLWLPLVVMTAGRAAPLDGRGRRRSVWRDALIPSAVNLCGQVGWGACPYFVKPSTIGFLIRTSFLFTVLLGLVLIPAERRLARHGWFYAGAAACVAGVLAMAGGHLLGAASEPGGGLLLVLVTAMFWGGYAVAVRKFMAGYSVRLSFGVISLYTAGGLVCLMAAVGNWRALPSVPVPTLGILVLSAFVGIAFSHVLFYRGIQTFGPVVACGVQLATPFVTLLTAFVVLNERISWLQLTGGLSVVAGGALLLKAQSQLDSLPMPPLPPPGGGQPCQNVPSAADDKPI